MGLILHVAYVGVCCVRCACILYVCVCVCVCVCVLCVHVYVCSKYVITSIGVHSTYHVVPQTYGHLLVSLGAEVEAVRSKVGLVWFSILKTSIANYWMQD